MENNFKKINLDFIDNKIYEKQVKNIISFFPGKVFLILINN